MARSEAQFARTNSGDSVYLFVHEGLLRFADKMVQYTNGVMLRPNLPVVPQQLAPWQTQPQPDLIKGLPARIAELEAKLLESSESVINIGRECNRVTEENTRLLNQVALISGDRDKSNRRLVEVMAESEGLKTSLKVESEKVLSLKQWVGELQRWGDEVKKHIANL